MNENRTNQRPRGRNSNNRNNQQRGGRNNGGKHGGNSGGRGGNSQSRNPNQIKQMLDKYLSQAREMTQSGDRVAAEGISQHAEHYQRLYNELMAAKAQKQNSGQAAKAPTGSENVKAEVNVEVKAEDKVEAKVEEKAEEKVEAKPKPKPKAKPKSKDDNSSKTVAAE